MIEMPFQGKRPSRAYPDDAGFDLEVDGDHIVQPHGFYDLPLASRVKAPAGCWSLLIGRSSTFRNRGLLISTGVIDPGYTGPLFAVAHNMTAEPVHVLDGERIVQAIPMHNVAETVVPTRVERMPDTHRGESGFGSSGR